MKRLLFLFTILVAFFLVPSRVDGQSAVPAPSVKPSTNVDSGDVVTLIYNLSVEVDPNALKACPQNASNSCYEARICDEVGAGQGDCPAFSTNPLYGVVSAQNKTITFTITPTESKHVWLEKYLPPANPLSLGSNIRVSDETVITVVNSANSARCESGLLDVVSLRGGEEVHQYTPLDQLRLKFDGTKAYNFIPGTYVIRAVTPSGNTHNILRVQGGGVSDQGSGHLLWGNVLVSQFDDKLNYFFTQPMQSGLYRFSVGDAVTNSEYCSLGFFAFEVSDDGGGLVTLTPSPPSDEQTPFNLCQQAGDESDPENKKYVDMCNTCFQNNGVWTAVGCIPFNSSVGMIRVFITIGLGIAGGVVVLMVLAGSFLLSTSQGDPKRVDEAKGLIGSAVIGLLFVIFSVTILRFIGVDILQIPGLGGIK